MTAVSTEPTETIATDAIYYIPRTSIHPDPEQPRVHPDDELADSIAMQGIIQAITVRPHPEIENEWMIVDGERRWRGAINWVEIPCRLRLDLEDPSDRLITQLSANTGKPLSPIEQARAFKKVLDEDPDLSQAELAKRLGIARSTIGDRIRLVEIHPAWMKLIESGRLQVSHAPIIHQYRGVPDEYQEKAAKNVTAGENWQMRRYKDEGDVIPIADFRKVMGAAFRDYIIKLDQVRSYKGPVIEVEEENWSYGSAANRTKKVRYAADIKLWRPIKREAEKRAKKARGSSSSSYSGQRYESLLTVALRHLKEAGYEVPSRKSKGYADKLEDGESEIFDSNGWASGIHPRTLLERIDPSQLTVIEAQYGRSRLVTTDTDAVAAAQAAYRAQAAEATTKELAPLKTKLSDTVLAAYAVTGLGVKALVGYLDLRREDGNAVALALGVSLEGGDVTQADAEKLLAAIAACAHQDFKIPNHWTLEEKIRRSVGSPTFKVAKNKTPASTEPKSKKQQKREARAAGQQVGDPSRAHDDNLHGLLDERSVEEEELVEA